MGESWTAAGVGSLLTAVLFGTGVLLVRYYGSLGKYKKDVTEADVTRMDAERRVRREQEDADRKARREEEDADRLRDREALEEYKELVKALKRERAEDRELIHELRNEMAERAAREAQCEIRLARAFERISALEEALTNRDIPFRKFDPDLPPSGSGHHRPLPPGAAQQ